LWGNGFVKRELIYVDDVADACLFLSNKKFRNDLINIGTGIEFSIQNYAKFIMKKLNVSSVIKFKGFEQNGMRRKLMDLAKLKETGWKFKFNLEDGFRTTYRDFLIRKKIIFQTNNGIK
jgi:GDP-L-fucose synthase